MKLRLMFLIGTAIPLAADSSAQPVVPPSPTFFPKFHAFVRFAEMAPNDGEPPVEAEAWNRAFREAIPDTASDMLRLCLYVAYLRYGTTSSKAIQPRNPLGFERSSRYELATYLVTKGFQQSRPDATRSINDTGLSYILGTCFTPGLKVTPQGISGYGVRGHGGQGPRYIDMFSNDLVRSHEHLIKDFDRIFGGPEDAPPPERARSMVEKSGQPPSQSQEVGSTGLK